MNTDPVDAILQVMEQAFDPAFGEAWNRRQVADAIVLSNTHYLLAGDKGPASVDVLEQVLGFTLSRQVLDEEELLLVAVMPGHQGKGVGQRLMESLHVAARERGSTRIFLEMRDGNPAQKLYTKLGYEQIGRRRDYYHRAAQGPLDAVTFGRSI